MPTTFDSHLLVPLAFGLGFVAMQVLSLNSYRRWLRAESGRLETDGDLDLAPDPAVGDGGGWVHWVRRHFPEGVKQHGNFARDDAFQELNWRLTSQPSLSILHRLGVIAPLLGVIITGWSLLKLRLPSFESAGALDLSLTIRPIVGGILLGGILSIINQILLGITERESDALRERSRGWFDERVWPRVVTREESTNRRAAEAMETTASRMNEFARMHNRAAAASIDATGVIERSADMIRLAVAAVSTEWHGSVSALSQASGSVEKATQHLARMIPEGARLSERMVNAIDRFGEIVETRFAERVRLQEQAASQLARSAETLDAIVSDLDAGTKSLLGFGARHAEAGERFLHTFEQAVVPNQAALVATSASLGATVEGLNGQIGQLDGALREAATTLTGATPDFRRVFSLIEATTGQFRSVVDGDLATAARRHRETIDDWSEVARSTDGVVVALRAATEPLGSLIDGFRQAGRSLKASIEDHVAPAGEQLHKTATTLNESTVHLGAGLDAIDKSLDRTTQAFSRLTERGSETLEQFRSIVADRLAPAAEFQREAAASMAEAFGQVRASAEGMSKVTESARTLIAREIDQAESTRGSAVAIRTSTESLTTAIGAIRGVIADDIPPLQAAIRESLVHLSGVTGGLGVSVADGSARMLQQLQGLDGGLARMLALLESLRPIQDTGPEIKAMLDGLGTRFDRLAVGIERLTPLFDDLAKVPKRRRGLFGG